LWSFESEQDSSPALIEPVRRGPSDIRIVRFSGVFLLPTLQPLDSGAASHPLRWSRKEWATLLVQFCTLWDISVLGIRIGINGRSVTTE